MNDLNDTVSKICYDSTFQRELHVSQVYQFGTKCWGVGGGGMVRFVRKTRLFINWLRAYRSLTHRIICWYGCEVILHLWHNSSCSLNSFWVHLKVSFLHICATETICFSIYVIRLAISHKYLKMAETCDENVVKSYYIFTLLHKVFENPCFSKSSMKIYSPSSHSRHRRIPK